MISVKYIGKRQNYIEGAYGSKLAFVQGESKLLPEDLATKLLRHPDVFIDGDTLAKVAIVPDTPETEDVQENIDSLATMDSDALAEFALIRFNGYKLDKRKSTENLRLDVTNLIHQYGLL